MVNVLGADIPIGIGSFSGGLGSGIVYWITIAVIIFLAFLILVGLGFLWYMSNVFNKRITLYENISGQGWKKTFTDRARLVKIGNSGEEVLYLLKKKVYRTAYGKKMDTNEYWFAVGQDVYWYNFVLGDLDAKMGILDIEPIDRDMRYMYVAISMLSDQEYTKKTFFEKYGLFMMNFFFMCVMLIGIWFLLNKIGGIATAMDQAVKSVPAIQQTSKEIVGALGNICTPSQLVPA